MNFWISVLLVIGVLLCNFSVFLSLNFWDILWLCGPDRPQAHHYVERLALSSQSSPQPRECLNYRHLPPSLPLILQFGSLFSSFWLVLLRVCESLTLFREPLMSSLIHLKWWFLNDILLISDLNLFLLVLGAPYSQFSKHVQCIVGLFLWSFLFI